MAETRLKNLIRRIPLIVLRILTGKRYFSVQHVDRTCTICGYEGRFRPAGLYAIRPDVMCPACGSAERHRLLKLWHDEEQSFFDGKRVLHFAPEPSVQGFIRGKESEYVTADLIREDVDHNWNIEQIDTPDASFDTIVCCHVLEHVDASKALAELHRILKPGGTAVVMVPINEALEETYFNRGAADGSDEERWLHFHQTDHICVLGRDFRDWVREAGFDLREFTAASALAAPYSLLLGDRVFLLRKPEA